MSALTLTDDYVYAGSNGRVNCSMCPFDELVDGPFTTNMEKWGPFQFAQEHARGHGPKSLHAQSSQAGVHFYLWRTE